MLEGLITGLGSSDLPPLLFFLLSLPFLIGFFVSFTATSSTSTGSGAATPSTISFSRVSSSKPSSITLWKLLSFFAAERAFFFASLAAIASFSFSRSFSFSLSLSFLSESSNTGVGTAPPGLPPGPPLPSRC